MGDEDNRPLTEEEKKARKKAERERKRKEARENAEKKKRFGLTPEKKRKLKLLILKKATEDLQNEATAKLEAKKKYISDRLKDLPDNLQSSNEAQLVSLCKDLFKNITQAEENKYDMEIKIRKQDYDINELTVKVNDIKGKFIKPTLKKVSKTKSKLSKIEKLTEPPTENFKANLKSTGINKFALDKEEDKEEKTNFRDQVQLKSSKETAEE